MAFAPRIWQIFWMLKRIQQINTFLVDLGNILCSNKTIHIFWSHQRNAKKTLILVKFLLRVAFCRFTHCCFFSHWNWVCVCQRKNCIPQFKQRLLDILKWKKGHSQFASPICVSTVKFVFHTSIPLFCSVLSRESVPDVAHISVKTALILMGAVNDFLFDQEYN